MEAETAVWQELEKNQAQVEALNNVEEFHRNRPQTEIQMRLLWEPLLSAKRRAGGIEELYLSYTDMMVWARARKQQQQQQQQQSESEVVRLARASVGGAGRQYVFYGGWNRRGFRRDYAYAEQVQQR